MKTTMLSALAGAVFLASGAVAGAGEPVKLGPSELDSVTAGTTPNISVRLNLSRTAVAGIGQEIRVGNRANVTQVARARTTNAPATATNTSTLTQNASNSGSQTNNGSATANASGRNF